MEEYRAMGYPIDQATLQAANDKLRLTNQEDVMARETRQWIGGKRQTKAEQEALLNKAMAHASNPDNKKATLAEAGYVDFSKSIDD